MLGSFRLGFELVHDMPFLQTPKIRVQSRSFPSYNTYYTLTNTLDNTWSWIITKFIIIPLGQAVLVAGLADKLKLSRQSTNTHPLRKWWSNSSWVNGNFIQIYFIFMDFISFVFILFWFWCFIEWWGDHVTASLLSLIPPSCMVVPNRDLGNKQFSSSAFTYSTAQMAWLPADSVIDVDDIDFSANFRGRSHSSSRATTRSTLLISSASSILYHEKMEINNDLPDDDFKKSVDSSQLSYKDKSQQENCVSKMTDLELPSGLQHTSNKASALNTLNTPCIDDNSDNIINIQILYNR